MEKRKPLPMTPFDLLTSPGELKMLKLFLPYAPPSVQRMLAFYIKFTELRYTIRYFGLFSSKEGPKEFSSSSLSLTEILEEIRPYLGEGGDTLDMILSALQMMEAMQGMDMGGVFSQGTEGTDAGGMPDLMQMIQMMQMPPSEGRADAQEGGMNDGTKLDGSPGHEEHGSSESGADQKGGVPDRG